MAIRRLTGIGMAVALSLGIATNTMASHLAGTMTMTKVAGPYKLVLIIGPAQKMGKGGEMSMGGHAAMCAMSGSGMHMGSSTAKNPCNHHVELHVYRKGSSTVVMHAHVNISMRDKGKRLTIVVPVMMMEGKGGMRDYHYGNNIHAGTGSYSVKVTVNNVHTTFAFQLQ